MSSNCESKGGGVSVSVDTGAFKEKLERMLSDAEAALAVAAAPADIEAVRIRTVGRSGALPEIGKELVTLPKECRPEAGKLLNNAKERLAAILADAGERLAASASKGNAEAFDVSLPGRRWPIGRRHPISKVTEDCVAIFRRIGFIVADGPQVETEFHNFDALNTPKTHPSRDPKDTFYFGDGRLLRTQTSTVQIRVMESQKPPVRIIAPGRVFRRDTLDASHSANFHQIEGLYVDRKVSMTDLKSILLYFAKELLGDDVGIRLRPHFFPFTEPSVECDFSCIICGGKGCRVCKQSGWLEIAGAGMVNPNVFRSVGYDPDTWKGLAFGMGVERIAMIRYRINDIRLLYENDMRFLSQF